MIELGAAKLKRDGPARPCPGNNWMIRLTWNPPRNFQAAWRSLIHCCGTFTFIVQRLPASFTHSAQPTRPLCPLLAFAHLRQSSPPIITPDPPLFSTSTCFSQSHSSSIPPLRSSLVSYSLPADKRSSASCRTYTQTRIIKSRTGYPLSQWRTRLVTCLEPNMKLIPAHICFGSGIR